ncbi:hypothetical protein [Pseudohongiella sp.]|uniref:Uncharacterized protein n=1 Tax=marine sediment metagenome TaxID=412755 RepID=A0A0F9VPJ5_9ZZZZ|nr:hypothetical protein [Pseudohongiella sp.]HDZ10245.1 hypothetical protein [Pseudohongiella sp.]HEA64225.1 hypothetical protein [Pseudohongiella sp.]
MRVLSEKEILCVSGGSDFDPMDVAISYSSTVIGAGVGMVAGGPVGGVVGAAVGFGAGLAMSFGYSSASGPGGSYYDDGSSCQASS